MSFRRRILIIGGSGWGNVGDDLIARSLIEWVHKSGRGHRLAGGPYPSGLGPSIKLSGRVVDRVRLAMAVFSAKHVVIGGGGLLDDRAPGFFRPFIRAANLARVFRRPYSFVGIGVGPVLRDGTASCYAHVVSGAKSVYVRDAASAERLRAVGVTREIKVVPDPVLWRPGKPASTRIDLVVNLRTWRTPTRPVPGFDGPEDREIAKIVASAINEVFPSESTVTLVGMCVGPGELDNDEIALEGLRPMLNQRVSTLYGGTPAEIEATIAAASCVLSMRLHACLVGVSSGVHVVGLAYDAKLAAQGTACGFGTVSLESGAFDVAAVAARLRTQRERPKVVAVPPRAPWLS